MKLHATASELAELEARATAGASSTALAARIEWAWHLRQRDSMAALRLCDEAATRLPGAGLPHDDLQRQLARIALTRAEVAALQCRLDAAEAQLALARAVLQSIASPQDDGDALLVEAAVAKARGQRERELEAYARAIAFYARAQDVARAAVARRLAAYERAFAEPDVPLAPPNDFAAGDDAAAQAACDALHSAARGLTLSRRAPAQAAESFLLACDHAQRVGLVRHAVVCAMNAGTALQGLGEQEQAASCFDVAAAVARGTAWPALLGSTQTRLGAFLRELGRLEDSHIVLSEALQALAATPAGINKANACSELAQTLLALGRGVESVAPMSEAIRMYRDARSTDNLALNLTRLARALAAAGQPQQALDAVAEAERLIQTHGFTALRVGVADTLAEVHRRHKLPGPSGMTAPTPAVHYGELTVAEGQAIAGWRPPAALHSALAESWAAAGDMAQAYRHARTALVITEQEGALKQAYPPAVLRLRLSGEPPPLDAAGLWRPVPAAVDDVDARAAAQRLLTAKEREILRLLARGYSNKQIATTLAVGDETVKWHLKRMFAKLDAGSRRHAVARARVLGLIGLDP